MPASKKPVKARVSVNDFAEFKHPRALAMNPDGRLLAYTIAWCDLEKKKYFSNLHVLDTQSGISRQWTHGETGDRGPVWSNDGGRLAFLRRVKGQEGIFVISREGGEAECIFKTLGSISDFKWMPDDTAMICKFRKADSDPDVEKAVAEDKEPEFKAPAVRKITRLAYMMDGEGFLPQERYQLYKLDLKSKEFAPLTKGKADVGSWDIYPDGTRVAYVVNTHKDSDLHPYDNDILVLNLKTGKLKTLPLPLGEKQTIAFSPNGKYLVYLGHHNLKDGWGIEQVHPWLLDLTNSKLRNLTPGFDRQPGDLTLGDMGYGIDPVVYWTPDSRKIYYQITDEGDTYLARVGITSKEPERVWDPAGQAAVFTVCGKALALVHLDLDTVGEIQFCEDCTAEHPAFERMITYNTDYFASHVFGKVKEVHFKSADGTKLHGWLITPPDFKPRKKYPAVLEVHGGPRLQYGRVFFHELQFLAAQGFVVFYTNPRGSQGYGKDFAGSTYAAWGTVDYEDIMAAADYLENLPFVDSKRIGIAGGSYGGYMASLCVGRTHRFRAAVAQRAVTNLRTMVETSDVGYITNFEFNGYPWECPEGYETMSPITYAGNVRTPTLIMHNEGDQRCAIAQAEQFYVRLKVGGKCPVEFWRFPEESHGMSRGGRPDRRVIRLQGIADWFTKWMGIKR
jgi:dipeptidyl aminopeptidase/acylaminoacyl peptidase